MKKKIKVEQLRPGMYIDDFNCSWLENPFFSNSIKINDEETIEKTIDNGIREVYIDTDKGLDVDDAPTEEEVKQYGLYEYPNFRGYYCPSILGAGENLSKGNRHLDVQNAKMGKDKEVRMWVLVYQNQPIQSAILQQNYWKGANKNEFVVCVGTDGTVV